MSREEILLRREEGSDAREEILLRREDATLGFTPEEVAEIVEQLVAR